MVIKNFSISSKEKTSKYKVEFKIKMDPRLRGDDASEGINKYLRGDDISKVTNQYLCENGASEGINLYLRRDDVSKVTNQYLRKDDESESINSYLCRDNVSENINKISPTEISKIKPDKPHEDDNKENETIINAKILKYDLSKQLLYFEINKKLFLAKTSYNKDKSINISLNNSCNVYKIKEEKTTQYSFDKSIEQDLTKKHIKSPISGRVIKCLVKTGDKIIKNQTLLIIESMKIENEIRSDIDGFIKTISVSEGDLVKQNQELITLSCE